MHTPHRTRTSKVARQTFLLALGFLLCGCATKKPEEEEKPKPPAPKLVGIIASLPPDRTFVLIQSYGTWDTPTGAILTTRGMDKRTANLLFTGEKLGRFVAADIQSGTVEKGDAVYSQHVPKPEGSSPAAPSTPATTTAEPPPEAVPETPLAPPLPE